MPEAEGTLKEQYTVEGPTSNGGLGGDGPENVPGACGTPGFGRGRTEIGIAKIHLAPRRLP
jgi:hypothetical protein